MSPKIILQMTAIWLEAIADNDGGAVRNQTQAMGIYRLVSMPNLKEAQRLLEEFADTLPDSPEEKGDETE